MAQHWIVEFVVSDSWVADGFQMTDERAVRMIQNEIGYAYGSEVSAQVIKSPDPEVIRKLQDGEMEPDDGDLPVACEEPATRTCRDCNGEGFYAGDGFSEDTKECGSCGGRGCVPN